MFLRCTRRKKNGKEHRYWSIVENKRGAGDRVVQRHVLYLGEINDRQETAWQRSIKVFPDGESQPRTIALFPAERAIEADADAHIVRVKLSEMTLRHPRQWGACWLACHLYQELGLDRFWAERLPPSRKGTRWDLVLQTLCAYRLIDPGSEWRLHREWFEHSAMGDLLGAGFAELAEAHKLYECHDLLLAHMKTLRQKLIDEIEVRGLSRNTQESYVGNIYRLARYYQGVRPESNLFLSDEGKRRFFWLASCFFIETNWPCTRQLPLCSSNASTSWSRCARSTRCAGAL